MWIFILFKFNYNSTQFMQHNDMIKKSSGLESKTGITQTQRNLLLLLIMR